MPFNLIWRKLLSVNILGVHYVSQRFISGTLKDGLVEQFTEICSEAFHVTRAFDGCQNINLTLHVENPHKFVLTEVWDSKEHYEKYAAFRVEDGTVAAIGNMCADGPNIDIFDITDA